MRASPAAGRPDPPHLPMAVFSLGSNLGDRLGHLRTGLAALRELFGAVEASPVYETRPVGVPGAPLFLNAVLRAAVPGPVSALRGARAAEQRAGRTRAERWAPRTLDVDVITVDGLVAESAELTLPHPRAALRAFVLRPWLDLDPAARLPGRGPVAGLLAGLGAAAAEPRRSELALDAGPEPDPPAGPAARPDGGAR